MFVRFTGVTSGGGPPPSGLFPFAVASANSAGSITSRSNPAITSTSVGPGHTQFTLPSPGAGLMTVSVSTGTPGRLVRAVVSSPTLIDAFATDPAGVPSASDFTIIVYDSLLP